jgi:ATP synthase protein I
MQLGLQAALTWHGRKTMLRATLERFRSGSSSTMWSAPFMRKPAQNDGSEDPVAGGDVRNDQSDSLEERRRQLGAKLASHAPKDKASGAGGTNKTSYAKAFQLSTEFVAAIFVGALLGYLLDRFLGTTPWGMIIFLLLGFVAGVLNVMRSAGVIAENRVVSTHNNDKDDAEG